MIELTPVWGPKAAARVSSIRASRDEIAICDATRLECLIKPIASGNSTTEQNFRDLFADPKVRMLPVTTATWEHAAQLGAKFNFKPMDSLHLATAIEHGYGLFVTADARLARCTDIVVEVLR